MKLFLRIIITSILMLCSTALLTMSYGPVYMAEQDLNVPNDNPAYPYPFIYPQYWDDTIHIQPQHCKERQYFEQRKAEQTKAFARGTTGTR